jgi:CheY-like chemotaxis protein
MDVQMPIIDGYKCTHLLRHHVPYRAYVRDVPIVAMTASAIQGDREKCRKAGMDDYLAKPVKRKVLERMLVRWGLSRRRAPSPSDRSEKSFDCSETASHCSNNDIPMAAVDELGANDGDPPLTVHTPLDDRQSPPTPRPRNCDSPGDLSPVGLGSPIAVGAIQVQRAETDEMALLSRAEKLMDAAGAGPVMTRGTSFQSEKSEALTAENVERLAMKDTHQHQVLQQQHK